MKARICGIVMAGTLFASPLVAQDSTAATDTTKRAKLGSEFLLPLGSIVLPGLGQYVHGANRAGVAFTATSGIGFALSGVGDATHDTSTTGLPRRGRDQLAEQGVDIAFSAASLSAWDAFHRAIPALRQQGKYEFITRRETVGELITAPFDPSFLKRWTTWVDLAQAAAVAALVLSEREPRATRRPFRSTDAAYTISASMNAAVAEEALFRGWLLPLLHQQTGNRFWLANGVQAGAFAALHLSDAEWFAAFIGAWAAWEGWIVRRNDWSLRESVFHHFWYDAAVIAATFLTEKRERELRITFPAISF